MSDEMDNNIIHPGQPTHDRGKPITPFVLRAMACDIEECDSPQSWADRCRAAAREIEVLKAALKEAADALHFGGQKARSPSFASKIFLAESNVRKVLDEGK